MDGNKDDAKIAENSIESGDRSRALKFVNKARRLDPSIETDEFVSKLNALQLEDKNPNETTNQKPFNPLPTTEQVRLREMKRKKEQVAVVGERERKKDFYEILRRAEDNLKAYRKLSLKVHPYKNLAAGAEDSFKKVSQAFQCLSNEESRRKYDLETSLANKRLRVSQTVSPVSRINWMEATIIKVTFGVGAVGPLVFYQPLTMKMLMTALRKAVTATAIFRFTGTYMFNLSGSFRLKYEYQGKTIILPKEDDLEADNELRTCIHRLKSFRFTPLGNMHIPIRMSVEFM